MSRQRAFVAFMVCCAVAVLVCAPAASAVVPSTVTRSDAVLAGGGSSLGTAQFVTVFDDATATATVSAGALKLRSGATFRIRSCVWHKAAQAAPQSVCESREVKGDLFTSLTGVAAPQAQMHVSRPASGRPAATIAGIVLVDERNSGRWIALASSWPKVGMPAAGVAVPAVDAATGAVLGPQGPAVEGVRPGGINTFAQDSICRADERPATTNPRGQGDALGSLPFAYEVEEPVAARVRGTILILHGGGWYMVGRGVMEIMRGEADRWRARGWRTVIASYRACSSSIDDVAALFDRVHGRYGASKPMCATGQSAGAHLALLLSAMRPHLACAIAQSGPADLASLADQTVPDPSGGSSQVGSRRVANMAVAAFGADRLASLSPTRLAVRARVLFAIGAGDSIIPWAQATGFAAAQHARDPGAYVNLRQLATGSIPWIHASVSQASLNELYAREKVLVAPLTTITLTAPKRVRATTLTRRGLPVSFICPSACTVSLRLKLGKRSIATATVRRASFGPGKLTVRLSTRGRKRLRQATVKLIADVRADGTTKQTRRLLTVR